MGNELMYYFNGWNRDISLLKLMEFWFGKCVNLNHLVNLILNIDNCIV